MKTYDQTASDGTERIAVVRWDHPETADKRFGRELTADDLPADFAEWSAYQRYAHDDCTVEVLSRGGE